MNHSSNIARLPLVLVPVLFSLGSARAAVEVSIQPASFAVSSGQTKLFTATVTGTSNETVTWSIQPSVGSISAAGLYQAPATVSAVQNITVTAQSVANASAKGTATLTLVTPPTVSPATVNLSASQSQTFSLLNWVGASMRSTWTLNPAVGSVTAAGVYTAPAVIASAETVTITGTNPNFPPGSATIHLIPASVAVSVAVTPSTLSLIASQAEQFTAAVTGSSNTNVTWSVNPNVGTISAAGLYTAPALIPSAEAVTVTATSAASPTKSASAVMNLVPVAVSMNPTSASLTQSQTQTLTATVTGSSNTGVTWSTPSVGNLVTNGSAAVYASPSTINSTQTVQITATSMADMTKSASAAISLAAAITISLAPATVTLNAGQTQQFTPTVAGTSNSAVTWSLSPQVGTISATGLYTAPATVLTAQNVTVTAQNGTASASSTVSLQATPQLQWSLNQNGLASLSYSGQSFYQNVSSVVLAVAFSSPAGTTTYVGANLSSSTLSSNPPALLQVYNLGQPYQFTLLVTYTQTDNRTLQAVAQVTNNDPVNTLVILNLDILSINLPGPATQYNENIPLQVDQYSGSPVSFLSGSWGSIAMWQSGYPTASRQISSYSSAAQTAFANNLSTYTNYGPWTYSLQTLPGASNTMTQLIRFGASTDTAATLAPDAYAAYAAAFPDIVNWPDRRPIAFWMTANGPSSSSTNPRGYLWNSAIDISQTASFQSSMLAWTNNTISILNGMTVRPQGIIIWDVEGEEFLQPFTYVGYPSQLPNLAPEMDAIADAIFAKLTAAGYRVGVTIRPNHFGTGGTLPSTCTTDPNYNLWDKFILLNASYPYQGYECSAPNTWQVSQALGPTAQTTTQNYSQALNLLQEKISYAHNRWGATLFYIDSSVWEGGTPIDPSIFRTLAAQFPDSLLIPEITNTYHFGATAPYSWTGGSWNRANDARALYPGAFQVFDVSAATAANVPQLVQMVQAGDILLFRGWFNASEVPIVEQVYGAAGIQ